MKDPVWADYLKALNRCCDAVKLAAFHTSECAMQVNKTADHTLLTVHHVKNSLEIKRRLK